MKPALKARCYECHGDEKPKGKKLNLKLYADMNGQRGILAVINTGKPKESELLKRITALDDTVMPEAAWDNKAKKIVQKELLKKEVVEAIEKWITAGAPPASDAAASSSVPMVSTKTLVAVGKAVLTGLLAIFLVLVIHYLTGRFFDANESIIIASTPSRISTATVPNALAVLFWIASIAMLMAAVVKAGTLALEDWRGQPVLVVNTASQCGYTYQYEGMQSLYDRYRNKGLIVLAIPSLECR